MGATEEDFSGRYGFPGFLRVFVSTTGLESSSLRPEKFSKRFSFGGGSVPFFLLYFRDFADFCQGCSGFIIFLFRGLLREPTRNILVRDPIRTFPEKMGNPPVCLLSN